MKNKIGDRESDSFFQLLENMEKADYLYTNLSSIRVILESIAKTIAIKSRAPQDCWDQNGRIKCRSLFRWIFQYNRETETFNYQLQSNSLIRNFCYTIYEITSDFGAHTASNGYPPTINTIKSLVFALKDIIKWADLVLSENN